MDIKSAFATDLDLEVKGVWVTIEGDAQVRVARLGNDAYNKRLQDLMRPYRKQIQRKTMPDAKAEEIYNQVIAETILVDWKGITEDGKKLPYSVENALRLLSEVKDFKAFVVDIAETMDYFKSEEVAADEKN